MVIIKDFDAPRNCVDCQNEGLSEIVGCGLFDECGKHPDCPFIEIKEGDYVSRADLKKWLVKELEEMPLVTPTHGTCKDCSHRPHGMYCTTLRTFTTDKFYCKGFERREE